MSKMFRLSMDADALRDRMVYDPSNPVYALARLAAGREGLATDRLAWALKRELPKLIAQLAQDLQQEYKDE